MLLIAASCAVRLSISRSRGRATETDADGLHVLMGVAMAGMLEPRLSPVPGTVWQAVFAAAAAWFAWRAVRTRTRARSRWPRGWQCVHPGPHAIECAAMVYMLLPAGTAGYRQAMAMPGMSGPAAAGNPAVALVFALFMLGYVLWATDRLAALSRARAVTADWPAVTQASAAGAALAPRFAACYKIAMGVAMGYMLITML
jgi:hypothetical protein